ncbi:MAG: YitT family protein [Anaerovoracaceae bacterium]
MTIKDTTKQKIKRVAIDILFLVPACCVGAFSTVGVLIPNGLTSGGITGIVVMVQRYVNIDFSILYYGGSILILISVAIFLGFKEFRKILFLTIMYPAILFIFEKMNIQLLEEKDLILAAIFCGVFTGICVGVVFWRGYSFSGTDAIARIIQRKFFPQVSVSKILLVIDGVIITTSALIFGRNIALYALVTQVIMTRMVDIVIYGFEDKIVQLDIITCKSEEISEYIMKEMDRGVSSSTIVGEYTKQEQCKLSLLCSPRESVVARRKIAELDPKAFVTVLSVEAVWGAGAGFNDIDKEH